MAHGETIEVGTLAVAAKLLADNQQPITNGSAEAEEKRVDAILASTSCTSREDEHAAGLDEMRPRYDIVTIHASLYNKYMNWYATVGEKLVMSQELKGKLSSRMIAKIWR